MKNKILFGIGMAVSFIAGGVTGYFLRKKTEVTFEEVTEEELQEYARKCEEGQETVEKTEEPEDTEDPDGPQMTAGKEDSANTIDTRKVDYTKMWKEKNGAVNEAVAKAKEVYDRHSEPGEEEHLEISDDESIDILDDPPDELLPSSGAEFYGDEPDMTKMTVIWHEEDDVVTLMEEDDEGQEEEVVINEPVRYFGFDIREEFDKAEGTDIDDMGSAEALYKRNDARGILYQLIHQQGSYSRRKAQEEYGGTLYNNIWNH